MQTIFWHDYETFGADPKRNPPCQFAGIRTDLELNIIEDPVTFYCAPAEDCLPEPEACLVTGITPQKAKAEGLYEAEFAFRVNKLFSQAQTCVAGYNSLRFDDEVTRNLLYRNFYDPYLREWSGGNSRWDLIDVVRLVHALRPSALVWPKNEAGVTSFKLESLTLANGIEHASAHDAMSDVYATITLAKLIKQREPALFDWAFAFRNKAKVQESIIVEVHKPLLHISSKYSADKGCVALVAPLFWHPTNKNGVLVFDLRANPGEWSGMSVEQLRESIYKKTSELKEGEHRLPVKTVHINKCPILLPASSMRKIEAERRLAWGLDEDLIRDNLKALRSDDNREFIARLRQVFEEPYEGESIDDPDLMIYQGGFFGPADKKEMERIRLSDGEALASGSFRFQDERLPEMLVRYKARNFPEILSEEEADQWHRFRCEKLLHGRDGYLNFKDFGTKLARLLAGSEVSESQKFILEELQYYAESIFPYE